jgi:hypothetical protein
MTHDPHKTNFWTERGRRRRPLPPSGDCQDRRRRSLSSSLQVGGHRCPLSVPRGKQIPRSKDPFEGGPLARTIGKLSISDLIDVGALNAGERIVINRRSAKSIEGVVQADGTIKTSGKVYGTPSTAAREVLSVGSVDGWLRWRVPRLDNSTLAELRDSRQ